MIAQEVPEWLLKVLRSLDRGEYLGLGGVDKAASEILSRMIDKQKVEEAIGEDVDLDLDTLGKQFMYAMTYGNAPGDVQRRAINQEKARIRQALNLNGDEKSG